MAPGRRAARSTGCCAARASPHRVLYIPCDLRRSRVSRRQSAAVDVVMGIGPGRAAARGDAARDGLAAADHRDRLHGLRARRVRSFRDCSSTSGASWSEPRQPPVPDEPGHLRHRGRRRRDVRVPLRAVRRARRRAIGLGTALHRHRVVDRRPLRRRTGEGVSVFASALFGMLSGLVGRQRGHRGLADDSGDDPPRLSAPLRRRRSKRHRRPAARSRRRSWAPPRS